MKQIIYIIILSLFTGVVSKIEANVPPYVLKLSRKKNFIVQYVPKSAVKSINVNTINPFEVAVNVTYVDGLGFVEQKNSVATSVSGKDIVIPVAYDSLGREAKKYLPYVSSKGNGSIDREQFKNQKEFYLDSDLVQEVTNFPFSETRFDRSPLNRVTKQGAPGEVWQPQDNDNDHTVKFGYGSNSAEEIYRFYVDLNNDNLIFKKYEEYYEPSTMFVSTVQDENNGGVTREYKNKMGQVVLKRNILRGLENADTYYVYDDYGLLRYILSPKAMKQINDAFADHYPDIDMSSTDSFIKDLCYYYSYDELGRMVTKQLPGAEPIYMVYDKRDRLVLTQDGEQRKNNKWLYTKYDRFNRPVQTGVYTATSELSQDQMRSEVEANSNMYEDCNNGTYTNNSFPTTNNLPYTETVYDNYYPAKFGDVAFNTIYDIDGYSGSYNTSVKGQVTYTMVRVFDASQNRLNDTWTEVANYYDDKYRVVQTVSKTVLPDGKIFTETAGSNYSFTGRVENTIYAHQLNGKDAIVVKQRNEYDHADRLLRTYQKLEGAITKSEILYASFEYDELGQMIKKRLNDKAINTEYCYNIRGWLKELNNTKSDGSNLYSMNLHYNNTVTGVDTKAQYNGNISAISWQNSDKAEQRYGFIYDNLNRLTTADYAGTKTDGYNATYSYDINGNILTLGRETVVDNSGTLSALTMDNLVYAYDEGNQLQSIVDNGDNTLGFRQGSGNYIYDANGNMTVDPNKGLSDIKYNHMNLPCFITKGDKKIGYVYDAAGRKLANKFRGKTKYYFSNFVYTDDKLEYMICSDGLLNINGSTTNYEFHLKDHLGNTRVAVNETNDITQENNYYPFGLTFATSGSSTNKYLYNGKEKQEETEWLDYGARFYDAYIGRFFNQDRFAEKYVEMSPYQYGGNNPIKFIDVNGDSLWINYEGNRILYKKGKLLNKDGSDYLGAGVKRDKKGNIKIDKNGNAKLKGFLNIAVSSLRKIESTDIGAEMLSSLTKSEYSYDIKRGKETGFTGYDADASPYDRMDGAGSGGTIYLNKNEISGGYNSDNSTGGPLFIGLGHELAHAWDASEGMLDLRPMAKLSTNEVVTVSELSATFIENKMRSAKGLPLRTHYGVKTNKRTFVQEGEFRLLYGSRSLYYNWDFNTNSKYK
ncbi:MAG: DUF6443 domain-containing protein [Bacteroidales bacterium]|jgi:RHS repeat-associated protein|nr:DUF6443 domain-containing protein [Bacteroidales bacterium]